MRCSRLPALIFLGSSLIAFASEPSPRMCHVQVTMSNGQAVPANLQLQVFDRGRRITEAAVPLTGSVALPEFAPGDYRVQTGGAGNFLMAGSLHVRSGAPCELGIVIAGRTDSTSNIVEDDIDIEDLRVSPKGRMRFHAAFADFQRGELERARQGFLEVTKLAPRLARAYNILGVIADQQKDSKASRQYFEKALELNPQSKIALMNLAKLSMLEQRYDSALALLERYRVGTREIAAVHGMEADAYLHTGKFREAIREAQTAHALPHGNWETVHAVAGAAYEALHEPELAAAEYRQYMEESSNPAIRQAAANKLHALTAGLEQNASIPMNSLLSH